MKNYMDECGCCSEEHGHQDGHNKIYLTLMDDTELECDVIDIFEADSKGYIALLPNGSDRPLLYRFTEGEEGPELTNIESDDEYEQASKAFLNIPHP